MKISLNTTSDSYVLPARRGMESKSIPVALLNQLQQLHITSYDLEQVTWFHHAVNGAKSFRWAKMSELVGDDLTGKTVYAYSANYEDSEWKSTNLILEVTVEGDSYRFTNPAYNSDDYADESHEWWDAEWFLNQLWYPNEEVLIVEK